MTTLPTTCSECGGIGRDLPWARMKHLDWCSRQGHSPLGTRREFLERAQINLGPCAHCGQDVWRYENAPVSDGPVLHKRICADHYAAGTR